MELKPQPADVLTLLECAIRPGQQLVLLPLGNSGQSSDDHLTNLVADYVRLTGTERRRDTVAANIATLRDFVEREFTKEVSPGHEYAYRITTWFYERYTQTPVRDKALAIDGLAYTSVASGLGFSNFAVRPESADSKLAVRRVFVYEFLSQTAVRQLQRAHWFGPAGDIYYAQDGNDKVEDNWMSDLPTLRYE